MKIFLASLSSVGKNQYKNVEHIKYALESFFSIPDSFKEKIPSFDIFLLDSGAFSFMTSQKNKKIDWDEYIEQYAKFINENDVKYFFELDIDSLVGIKEVERLREKLEKLTNKKCIPVWHKSRGFEYWKKLCKEYDYIAIGGIVTKEIKRKEYDIFIPLLEIAKQNNCKVHGLGFTNLKLLKKYHFFSVDSTSWRLGRFGIVNEIDSIGNTKNIKLKDKKLITTNKSDLQGIEVWTKIQNLYENIG